MKSKLTRRDFLRASSGILAGTALAACAPVAAPAPAQPAPVEGEEKPPAEEAITISILVPQQYALERPENRNPDAQVMMDLFDEYATKVKPNITIELEELVVPPGQAGVEIVRVRAQAGNIPDLVAIQPVTSTMVADLFYQFPRALFDEKNPYSPNDTWWEDFPYDGVIFSSYPGAIPGTYWAVGMTRLGGSSVIGVAYNREMFVQAGIHDSVEPGGDKAPETWAQWVEWMEKLKAIDVIPFDMRNHISGGCCAVWTHSQIYDNLIEAHHAELEQMAADFFGEEPDGMLNPRYGVYLFKTGKWRFDDEYTAAYFRILEDWSNYFHPGFLGESTTNFFLDGKAAMIYVGLTGIPSMRRQLEGKFKWGTFYVPTITAETWEGAPGLPQRGHAASGLPGGFAFGGFFQVPQKTIREGKFDAVLDFLRWITAPEQLEKYGDRREPKSAASDATAADVYPDDPEMQEQYRFHFEPTAIREGKRYGADEWWHVSGVGNEAGFRQTIQAYLSGQLESPEAAAAKMQEVALGGVERWIAENPEQNADEWK